MRFQFGGEVKSQHQIEGEEVTEHVQAFLASGGTITPIPTGVSGMDKGERKCQRCYAVSGKRAKRCRSCGYPLYVFQIKRS